MHGSGSPDPMARPAPPRRFSARRPERFVHRMTASELRAVLDAGQQPPGLGTVQVNTRGQASFPPPRLAINLVSFELHAAFRIPPLVSDCVDLQAGILRRPGR